MNPELEKTIMAAGDLPTIPIVATKVRQLLDSETTTTEDLSRVVASDPAVAARVLKISNSAFYGCQRKIQTLSNAIVILGFNTLKSLVIAASVKQVYHPFGLTEKMFWDHSFGAALAARIIAGNTRLVNEEEAFLGGLFHDIGKVIMNSHDSGKFLSLIERCYNEGLGFSDAEQRIYPYTHEEVGGLVLKKWNFPQILIDCVLRHHTLQFEDENDLYLMRITAVANLADNFCRKLGIGERTPNEELNIEALPSVRLLGIGEKRISFLLETFQQTFEQDKKFFG